ncbi:cilia- and flagella-associated protein 69-like [Halictus rubicundus]|uniref:cilia- and flagella-associated protein 69-like n=1 Tax=Halictus rubicundus TaxID=77578 RepID=UPI004035C14B
MTLDDTMHDDIKHSSSISEYCLKRSDMDIEEKKSESGVHDKFDVRDVWKEFNCPKYVMLECPETDKIPANLFDFMKQSEVDPNYTLTKLDELISDPVTKDSAPRICRLLHKYLHGIKNHGYKVKDLPKIIRILEFLVQNVDSVEQYKQLLNEMLKLCSLPPLLEKSSEILTNNDRIEQYFTLLGKLLAVLPTKEQALEIHKAIHSLLLNRDSSNVAAIKIKDCLAFMEKSQLPNMVVKTLEGSLPEMYQKILELVFLLSSISYKCSHRMLEVGVLNIILVRMDLPYATQLRCTRPPDSLLIGSEYPEDTTILIMNTLWCLMKSILPPINVPNLKTTLCAHCALWGLSYTFERQIFYSQFKSISIKIRNEIAAIILTILITFPTWNFISSGIADKVIKFLIAVETGSVRVFSETITFGRTNEDLFFQKVLLLIAIHLSQIDACISIMVHRKLMQTILQLVNPDIERSQITWTTSQYWNLWTYAIKTLSVLAPKMPKDFVAYNGTIRLLLLLDWSLSTKFDADIITHCIKAICSITLSDNTLLLENFREHGIIVSLIKLINYILTFCKLTMKEQRILTLVLISIERLLKKQIFYHEMFGDQSIAFVMELLFQCLYQNDKEIQIDQRLLLALGSYIWECIVWCPPNLKKFVESGAVYVILDIIEVVPYPSQRLFLAVLTDMCDNYFCGSYLCTWRGINKKTTLMSLLARIWRSEEIRLEFTRCPNGAVRDEEFPAMSKKQWLETFQTKLCGHISPAMIDMIGSVRAKIYSIRKIIEKDNEKYNMAKQHYKILYYDLPVEDRITVSGMDLYFNLKLGQVWTELERYFEQIGITPLGMDGQAIFLMTQRYYLWGILLKKRQKNIIHSVKREEDIEEKDEYARIRDSKLILSLNALDELDYVYRATNREYMIKKKTEQMQQVYMALNFPRKTSENNHRTFMDAVNFTTIFDQHVVFSNLTTHSDFGQMKVLPVSPSESYILDESIFSGTSCSSLTNYDFSKLEQFEEEV